MIRPEAIIRSAVLRLFARFACEHRATFEAKMARVCFIWPRIKVIVWADR
jgi:hypothetical protein